MPALDVRTLYFVIVLGYAIFGLFQIGMWKFKPREVALLIWGISNLVTSAGNLLLSLRGVIPDPVSITVANSLLVLGYMTMWAGLRRFHEQKVSWFAVGLIPVFVACLFQFYEPVASNQPLRVAIHSLIILAFCVVCFYDAYRAQATELLMMRRVAMVVFALTLVFALLRMALNSKISSGSYVDSSHIRSLLVCATLVLALLWNMAILFMVSERLENRLQKMAHRDALTQLLNRSGFNDLALRQIRRCLRNGKPVSVLMMDIDYFKRINDEYGHDAGDRLLNAFASATQRSIRPDDLLSRYGGEEFCALLAGSSLEAAALAAERIRIAFEQIHVLQSGRSVRSTVSVGVAQVNLPDESMDSAIGRADQALYEAKRLGRNRVAVSGTA